MARRVRHPAAVRDVSRMSEPKRGDRLLARRRAALAADRALRGERTVRSLTRRAGDRIARHAMIFFYHIPKTAGISVLRSAKQVIPGEHRRVLLTEMRAWLADLDRGACDTRNIAFLSGHFAYGIHKRLAGDPQTLTFIRNPVEQTVSMHYESAKRPDIYPHGNLRALVSGP